MTEATEAEFEALAARLTDPSTPMPKTANTKTGAAAAASGRELMLKEYGSMDALDNVLKNAGRPRLGERAKGASPVVRGRVAEADRATFDLLIAQTSKKESELVREALHLLFEQYKIAS